MQNTQVSNEQNLSALSEDNEMSKENSKELKMDILHSESKEDMSSLSNTAATVHAGDGTEPVVNMDDEVAAQEFLEEDKCNICMNAKEYSEFHQLPCQHNFHAICLQYWTQVHKVCPTCNREIPINKISNEISYPEKENAQCAKMDDKVAAQEFFEDVKCNICMNNEESSEYKHLSCGHRFCSTCLQSWIQTHKTCPTCQKEILVNKNSNKILDKDSKNVQCAICYDTEDFPNFEFLPCCHGFHAKCIQNWFEIDEICPLCKTSISVNHTRSGTYYNRNIYLSRSPGIINLPGGNILSTGNTNMYLSRSPGVLNLLHGNTLSFGSINVYSSRNGIRSIISDSDARSNTTNLPFSNIENIVTANRLNSHSAANLDRMRDRFERMGNHLESMGNSLERMGTVIENHLERIAGRNTENTVIHGMNICLKRRLNRH